MSRRGHELAGLTSRGQSVPCKDPLTGLDSHEQVVALFRLANVGVDQERVDLRVNVLPVRQAKTDVALVSHRTGRRLASCKQRTS